MTNNYVIFFNITKYVCIIKKIVVFVNLTTKKSAFFYLFSFAFTQQQYQENPTESL